MSQVSPSLEQPRAIGALFALEEGLNVVISRPGLFGFVPCAVLLIRACLAAGAVVVASAFGLDQLFWELNGVSLFEISSDAWALAAMVGGDCYWWNTWRFTSSSPPSRSP